MPCSSLFAAFPVAGMHLPNRIVMAPMTREMAGGGVPTEAMARYYGRRAAGGAGLIITEGAAINLVGSFGTSVPRFYGDDVLQGWRRVVDAVHAHGSAILAQLWHVGAFCPSLIGMDASHAGDVERLSPSGLAAPGRPFGRTMTQADIDRTIDDFAQAAMLAQTAGFDGIEIHGAHGYLLDQFIWAETNRRTDRYGGDAARRITFAVEVVRAIRAATGAGFAISFRLSQWKQLDYRARLAQSPAELACMVQPLVSTGVDIFHCSIRRFWEPEFPDDPRNLAAWVKALSGKPTITVGSVTLGTDFKEPSGKIRAEVALDHLALVEEGLARGDWDLVAVGRALIANPDWARLVAEGKAQELRLFEKSMLEELN